jgi:formate dehydrogenase major subunit
MLHVTVNGTPQSCADGTTILAHLRSMAIPVPALCDDPRLAAIGGCRMCLVEIAGHERPVAACTTHIADGMSIQTHSDLVEQLRRTQLRLLARQHPPLPRDGEPASAFHRLVRQYDLEHELGVAARETPVDDSHPCIHVDMSRCIDCFRCVRICEQVAGRFVWRAWNRGDRTEIAPAGQVPLAESACVSCGACVDACPSGALLDKSSLHSPSPQDEIRTVCPYCGTGCEMHVGRREDRLISARPVIDAPVNRGHLCVKGRYGWDFVHADDRITRPMIRSGDSWTPVSWPQAIEFVARRFREIVAQHGPDAVGVLGSARATNEENYLAQKFARVVLGTNNVDCCARVCHAPTAAGMSLMLGTGAATNSFDDIEHARTILVCGANPTENHPIVGDRIRQRALRGAELIVIDPRRIDLVDQATWHLQLRPGTNVPLLNALAHVIVSEGLYDVAAVERVENWREFQQFLAGYAPERVAEICGVPAEAIRQAARCYASAKPAMSIHGLGVTEHTQGTEGVMCLVNLAIMTGNLGRPGSGVNPLRGQNNVQGSAHMGCEPATLTGGAKLVEHRTRFQTAWQTTIPDRPGRNLMQMIDGAAQGAFKALWAIGYDVALTNPDAATTLAALKALDLVVVQDLFLTETAKLVGSVFLPACSSFEKDGTFMNSERRIQRVRKVIEPLGESRSDWEIICDVANGMGRREHFSFQSAEDIWNEIRVVWPAGAGITYRRLDAGGLQWPCPTEHHPGTAILHSGIFSDGRRLSLRPIEYRPTTEQVSAEFPLLLVTGRTLYQFNAGTMTSRSKTQHLRPTDLLLIAPDDAARVGIEDNQMVKVTSRYGQATIVARTDDRVRSGELFATFHTPRTFLNQVTSHQRDRMVQTPEYKVTAVRVEAAP